MERHSNGALHLLPVVLSAGVALGAGCANAEPPPSHEASAAQAPAGAAAVLARQPLPDVFSAGQPAAADWPGLAAAGITTVIDLRPDAERPDRDEAAEVKVAGLAYRQLPVAGAQDLTPEAARTLWQAIDAAPGKVLVHCASGNRAGALLAIAAVREGGMAPSQALEAGRAAGMTSLEPRVREVLGVTASGDR